MSLVNKKYVVLIDNVGTTEEVKELCYKRALRRRGKTFYEFAHNRVDGYIFSTIGGATKCCNKLHNGGYLSRVEVFYML